jgi:foldase protein PrsA
MEEVVSGEEPPDLDQAGSSPTPVLDPGPEVNPIVASYTGRNIRAAELATYFFAVYREQAFAALSKLVGTEIVDQEARRVGLEVPSGEMAQWRAEILSGLEREAALSYGIGTSAERYVQLRFRQSLAAHLAQRLDQERQRYLFSRIIRYHALGSDQVGVDIIVVRSEARAREIAEKLDQGADFGRLAGTWSIHESRSAGGRLPVLPREALHEAVAARAFELPVGGRSGVLLVEDGAGGRQYEIIRVRERISGRDLPFSEVRAEIEAGLAENPVDVTEWTAWYLRLERLYNVSLATNL